MNKSLELRNPATMMRSIQLSIKSIATAFVVITALLTTGTMAAQTPTTIPSGSFIVNMGVTPQTIGNGMKPYGMVYDLVTNYQVPILWCINTSKGKDGTDFTYNGTDYKGGPFIILEEYRNTTVNSRISYWQGQGVVGITTTSAFTAPVYVTITSFGKAKINAENSGIAIDYFDAAGIPSSYYQIGLPNTLNACDDAYFMPHSDPEWATHSELLDFNEGGGDIWAGCRTGSVLEGMVNPSNNNEATNFLTTNRLQCYSSGNCGPLVTETHNGNPTLPYAYHLHGDPFMQFMGDFYPATTNGSEKWYIPQTTSAWRSGTKLGLTTSDGAPPREGVKMVFGRGFSDPTNGLVIYMGSHSFEGNGQANVAAMRTVMNFLMLTGVDHSPVVNPTVPTTMTVGTPYTVSASPTGGTPPYTYLWTTTCAGSFANPTAASTTFTPSSGGPDSCFITIRITDACGRVNFSKIKVYIVTPLSVTGTATNVNCYGDCTGAVNITASGGQTPYSYSWSNGKTTEDLANLCVGSYTVTVTDAGGSTATASFSVNLPSGIQTYVTIASGNWTSSSTWQGGSIPDHENLDNDHVVIKHNVTVTNGNVKLVKCARLTIDCVDMTISNGNLIVEEGVVESQGGVITTSGSGSFQMNKPLSRVYLKNTELNLAQNFQNQEGIRVLENVCGSLYESFQNNKGTDTLINVTLNIGLASGAGFQNNSDSKMHLTDTRIKVNSGGFHNASNAIITGDIEAVWVPAGDFLNSGTWMATVGNYCVLGNVTVPPAYLPPSENCGGIASYFPAPSCTGCNDELEITAVVTNINCFGACTGAIDVTVFGGDPPYTYSWSNNATTEDLSNLCPGTYTVTVTDDDGETETATFTVTQPSAALAINLVSQTNVNCFGDATGAIDISISGGTSPYTYDWSNDGPETPDNDPQDLSNLPAGSYTVTVTDAAGCTTTASYQITQPSSALNINLVSQTNVNCFGDATGAIDISVSGGTSPYTYDWSNDGPETPDNDPQDLSNLTAGSYTVTVTDAAGCTKTATYNITQPSAALNINLVSQTNVNCFGDATGAIDISVSGGTSPYTYDWSNDGPETPDNDPQDLSNLIAGTYTVTVTDAAGCTKTASYQITQPSAALNVSGVVTPSTCANPNSGAIDITVTGGTSGYTYDWSNDGPETPDNDPQDLSGLTAGSYTVTVTDAAGCTKTATFVVNQTGGLTITLVSQTNVNCFGDSTGAIDISVSGGSGTYSYSWTGPGSFTASSQDISNLAAGTYNVTVSDGTGCTTTAGYTITQPNAALNISLVSQTNVNCFGDATGAIDISVTGGTAPYTYDWSNDGPETPDNDPQDLSNLTAGSYTVTVTDAAGCTKTATYNITQPSAALNINLVSQTNVNCFGDATGAIDISVSGGTSPYTYDWSNDGPETPDNDPQDLSNLTAGSYTVTVTDAAGCTKTATYNITQPTAALLINLVSQTNVNCFGDATGAIDISVSGGTSPYTYDWSNDGPETPDNDPQDLSNLTAGSYTVTVTDAAGCTKTATYNITQPSSGLVINLVSQTNVNCYGDATGAIDISVTGGTSPYTYDWSNDGPETPDNDPQDLSNLTAGSYTVTVTDAAGCTKTASYQITQPSSALLITLVSQTNVNCFGDATGAIDISVSGGTSPYTYDWSNDGPETPDNDPQDLSGLTAGSYTVTVTDAAGCTQTASYQITQPSAALTINLTSQINVSCYGGANGYIDITVTGGTPGYTYLWMPGNVTTEDRTGLSAGTYSVTVTDSKGCTKSASYTITQPSAPLTVTAVVNHAACSGVPDGSIDLTVSGGTPSYTYKWSHGPTTQDVINLDAGLYLVTVTDANGCVEMRAYSVGYDKVLDVAVAVVNSFCGANDGSVDITVYGGSGTYYYSWTGPGGFNASTEDINNLAPGVYTVTVTDSADGCSVVRTAAVDNIEGPLVTGAVTNTSCNGSNGSINVTVSGGTGPYTYKWLDGPTTEDRTNLGTGTYTIEVTDANGCKSIESFNVGASNNLTITGITTNATCNMANGSIDITVTGGTGVYVYLWSNGMTTQDISGVPSGTYVVQVTDNTSSCVASQAFSVGETNGPTITLTATNVSCATAGDGSISVTVTAGTGPFTFLWSNGETTQNVTNLTPGNYSVTVTDANGCETSSNKTITEPPVLDLYVDRTNVSCYGGNNGAADLLIIGGTPPYSVSWSGPGGPYNTEDLDSLVAGTYTAVVTDGHNCTNTVVAVITQPADMVISGITTNENCVGNADGTIDVTVNGGTAPFTYVWSDGGKIEDRTGLVAGTYTVTVTDANACVKSQTFTVSRNPAIDISSIITSVGCGGATTGSVDITVINGVAPYTFFWTGPNGYTAMSEDISGIGAGVYTVFVTDAVGCSFTEAFTVIEITDLAIQFAIINSTCGNNDGSINLTVSGGSGTYTYSWTTGDLTPNITGIGAGTYVVTVTDPVSNCSASRQFIVEDVSSIVLSAIVTNASCVGADGAIDLTVAGGSGSYSYAWSNLFSTQDIQNLAPGVYRVTVTDNVSGCKAIQEFTVEDNGNNALDLGFTTTTDATCGMVDGSIDLVVAYGSTFYTFQWSTGATTEDIGGLSEGIYSVTVTDLVTGCSTEGTFIIGNSNGPVVTVVVTNVTCAGSNNGSADITVSGGSGTYLYLWSNGSAGQDLTAVAPGTYYVEVTDSILGCVTNASATILEPAPLDLIADRTHVSCAGGSDGQIIMTVLGGTAPYSFDWGGGITTQNRANLVAGNYCVAVTDAGGCQNNLCVDVLDAAPIVVTPTVTNTTCHGGNDGAISLNVSGGTPPYTYFWLHDSSTGSSVSGLAAGTYSVIVTDSKNCMLDVDVMVNDAPAIVIVPTVNNVSCAGGNNGSISLSVSGGTGAYTFVWSNGATGNPVTNLSKGVYMVTVTDANGCKAMGTYTMGENSNLDIQFVVINAQCGMNDGSIDITVLGGSGTYTYNWVGVGTNNGQQDQANLGSGIFQVTVTDVTFGCTATKTITVDNVQGPAVTGSVTNTGCAGNSGAIDITPSGTGPFTYLWYYNGSPIASTQDIFNRPQGNHIVQVTDGNGCVTISLFNIGVNNNLQIIEVITPADCGMNNGTIQISVVGGSGSYGYLWSNGATTPNVSGLGAGTHSVTVTDLVGNCVLSKTFNVGNIDGPVVTMSVTDITCAGNVNGTVTANVAGGATYLWSTGATTSSISGLAAGTYYVTVTQGNCMTVESAQVQDATPIDAYVDRTNASCNGSSNGALDITVVGGTGTYTYVWTPGGQTSQDLSGLPAGNYCLVITDGNGCSSNFCVEVTQPLTLTASSTTTNSGCNGQPFGTIDLTVGGGTAPYAYAWSGGLLPQQDHSNLFAGSYTVTITDDQGCTTTHTANVVPDPSLVISATVTPVTCTGGNNGSITVNVTGGSGYSYAWSNNPGLNSPVNGNLPVGIYTVTVTAANGCMGTATYAVDDRGMSVNSTTINATCGNDNGEIHLIVHGGVGPFVYNWDGVFNGPDRTGLAPGIYNITVTDNTTGCTEALSVTVDNVDGPTVTAVITPANGCGAANGAIDLSVSGTGPFTYSWTGPNSFGSGNQDISGIIAGRYGVIVTDSNGCVTIMDFTVTENNNLVVIPTVTPSACGGANGEITINVPAGNYTFFWSNGMNGQTISNLIAGTYIVTVTQTATGCQKVETITVGETTGPLATLAPTNVTCASANDGAIDVTATGATYKWSTGATTQDLTNLAPGLYIVTVTSTTTGCETILSATITEPSSIHIHADRTDVECNGAATGSYTIVSVVGGTPGYTYNPGLSASNLTAGTYNVTVTDAEGCSEVISIVIAQPPVLTLAIGDIFPASCTGVADGYVVLTANGGVAPYTFTLSGQGSNSNGLFQNLATGTYSATVTDANGCSATLPDIQIGSGVDVQLSADVDPTNCPGSATGNVDLSVTPVTAYGFVWSNGVTTEDLTGVLAGIYFVTVTDLNTGCKATGVYSVNEGTFDADIVISAAQCDTNTGSIHVFVNGGTAPYTFTWNGDPGVIGKDSLTNLLGGIHHLKIEDAGGCTYETDIIVPNDNGPLITIESVTDASCDANDGAINISVTGGKAPYTFLWSNASTDEDISGLAAGTYIVIVTDNTGCRSVTQVTVNGGNLAVTGQVDPASCNGSEGSITVNVTGGSGPFTYTWSNGETTATISNLAAGIYSVTVMQGPNCRGTATFSVGSSLGGLDLTASSQTDVDCAGAADGQINVTVTGGNPPYSYLWTDGASTEDRSNLSGGMYTIMVTDNQGCQGFRTFTIDEADPMVATILTSPVCGDDNDGVVRVNVTGGKGNYTYTWNPPVATGDLASGLTAGTYSVTIEDGAGCSVDGAGKVLESNDPECRGDVVVRIPQVLTPNSDQLMDEWNIENIGEFPNNEVKIFNRWGDLVFQTTGYNNDWYGTYMNTGKPLPDGTYYWIVWLHDVEDSRFQGFLSIHR